MLENYRCDRALALPGHALTSMTGTKQRGPHVLCTYAPGFAAAPR
jgi:hypothetical protein